METKWVRAGLGGVAWMATGIGAIGLALHFSVSSARPLVLAASGAHYLMAGGFVGAVVFAALRRWRGVAIAGLVAIGAVVTQVPLHVGESGPVASDTAGRVAVQVMQANILFGGADAAAVVNEVRTRGIMILTVDELSPESVDALAREGLDDMLPHRYLSPAVGANGTGIWSAYPLSGTVEYDGFVMNQLSAIADVPAVGPVAVYAFHPVPPVFGTHTWVDELFRLRVILERAPAEHAAIVGADFNATFGHTQFRALLSGRFANAAEQVGAGSLATYPSDRTFPPVVGIDHILVAGGRATEVTTVDIPGTDHRAVVARIELDVEDHRIR
ncbi:MAG: endonuclease/exonuclease/phosphatase family protein [Rhodococcus sp. (in: high G+C Gram-positive bacteria)]|uniref:endonuclease/exonuclease/phosphatase family protein n=1 Tax=Rhodococcus sp. TaxID=1831 RepID=UPI003BB67291